MFDFTILRGADSSVQNREWARSENRAAMTQYFKLLGAQAEIERCNYEIGRVKDWLDKEDEEYVEAVWRIQNEDPDLAAYTAEKGRVRALVNERIRERLRQIAKLKGYTGPRAPLPQATVVDIRMDDSATRIPGPEDEPDTVPPDQVPDEEEDDLLVRLDTALNRITI